MALAEKMQNEEDLAAAQAEIDKEDAGQGEQPKGEPITSYVKQDLVKEIMEMGFG